VCSYKFVNGVVFASHPMLRFTRLTDLLIQTDMFKMRLQAVRLVKDVGCRSG